MLDASDYIQIAILASLLLQALVAFLTFLYFKNKEKKRATTQFLNSIRLPMDLAKSKVDQLLGYQNTIVLSQTNEDELRAVIEFLDYYEELGAGVNAGLYDVEMVDKIIGGNTLNVEIRFSKFMRDIAISQRRNSIYSEFREMCKKLRAFRSKQLEKVIRKESRF